jgi:BirA family transcriptional regulator, biotin operon repressor / biotin---[acetyl-CoA-carboxylase] ligase
MISTDASPFGGHELHPRPHDCAAAHASLCIDLIRRNLATETVGRRILLYGGVSSTNLVLRGLTARGAVEGTVVLAEAQVRGRGRHGRSWFSPPGLNLYVSVLFRPGIELREVPRFSFIASLALTETIWAEGLPAAIKWPNDVLVDDRKVAGTLVETVDLIGTPPHVILGVGVNMNVDDEALRIALRDEARDATSLREAAGREIDRNLLAASFLNHLEKWFAVAREQAWDRLLAAWRERDGLRGRRVEIRGTGPAWQGRAEGVDAAGYLAVDTDAGVRRRVINGEIRLLD